MHGLVSLTDKRWFDHLSGLAAKSEGQRLDEVNFWRPKSQQAVRSITPGAPFFLRLKRPHHAIAGFGFFAHWQLVPFSLAWELFGQKNGAPNREAFRSSITAFRGSDPEAPGATPLGCIVLRDVVFFERERWLPWGSREDWSRNIVNDKRYELASEPGARLLSLIRARYDAAPELTQDFQLIDCDTRRQRESTSAVREGQGTFKLRLLDAYGNRCAVTGEKVVPVLDAAHIQDYLGPASNHVQNGLVLRTDLHRLYDRGLVTVTPDYEFRVSERLQDEWENGKQYYELERRRLRAPQEAWQAPSREALAWHGEVRFG
ncbi:MAG: HNH endonuclease [Planctomycetota bacterium]|nr:MAG: HNH endonuclease [Planctomycetota bacterium]